MTVLGNRKQKKKKNKTEQCGLGRRRLVSRRLLFFTTQMFPRRAQNQTTKKQEVFCPFNSFVLGVTPLPVWGGLERTGTILDGESQRPWGAPSTVRQTTAVGEH